MKTLLLLRHAKSSWKDESLRDFDRPLTQRGIKAATRMGRFVRKRKLQPDLILSSPAERARETTAVLIECSGLSAELRYDERIYEASATRLLEVISQIEETAAVVMLVGHNPGFEELLESLTGENHNMSTAALACIELNVEKWNKSRAGTGRLEWLMGPKDLKSG